MNRKHWIIVGIIITILLVIGVALLLKDRSTDKAVPDQKVPVLNLTYCSDEQVKPCVVSFSTDANDNMLINILLPDLTFPNFYLEVERSEGESKYNCQRISEAVNSAYCTGAKLPPGEILHLSLISIRDAILLAEGDLSIIGLAYPTVGVAVPTLQEMPSIGTEITTQTNEPPTKTPLPFLILPTPTKTQPSYPNPSYPTPTQQSYPNPSYPTPTQPSYPNPLFPTPTFQVPLFPTPTLSLYPNPTPKNP